MPRRNPPLVTNYLYHVLNRSVGKLPILRDGENLDRLIQTVSFYRHKDPPFPFSRFLKLPADEQMRLLKGLEKQSNYLVEVVCFCLMPNHYHFVLKQLKDSGIETFTRRFQNSYAKYYNIKHKRAGPLFENRFRAVLVEDRNQLIHLSRYIHLNPYASFLVKKRKNLLTYPWSSLPQYLGFAKGFCSPKVVIQEFGNPNHYQEFVLNRADYQRRLEEIKHLTLE